ncbi:MAG: S-layer homology domain-containing protein, partial [Peptostreptococcaceae bacterium]|nr:S-layer homology domain-containing protein [Peptostreptococcaceae bacterium]
MPMNVSAATDVDSDISGNWAEDTIQSWMDKGTIKGYEDGTFRPDNNITRVEFMTLVNGIFNYTTMSNNTFTDVLEVEGETMIYGGGQNSIIIIDSTLGKVTVSKVDGKIRIVISGNTTVKEVLANSGVKLEESNLTGNSAGFLSANNFTTSEVSLILDKTQKNIFSKEFRKEATG